MEQKPPYAQAGEFFRPSLFNEKRRIIRVVCAGGQEAGEYENKKQSRRKPGSPPAFYDDVNSRLYERAGQRHLRVARERFSQTLDYLGGDGLGPADYF